MSNTYSEKLNSAFLSSTSDKAKTLEEAKAFLASLSCDVEWDENLEFLEDASYSTYSQADDELWLMERSDRRGKSTAVKVAPPVELPPEDDLVWGPRRTFEGELESELKRLADLSEASSLENSVVEFIVCPDCGSAINRERFVALRMGRRHKRRKRRYGADRLWRCPVCRQDLRDPEILAAIDASKARIDSLKGAIDTFDADLLNNMKAKTPYVWRVHLAWVDHDPRPWWQREI